MLGPVYHVISFVPGFGAAATTHGIHLTYAEAEEYANGIAKQFPGREVDIAQVKNRRTVNQLPVSVYEFKVSE